MKLTLDALRERLEAVEKLYGQRVDTFIKDTEHLLGRIEKLECAPITPYAALRERVEKLEAEVARLDAKKCSHVVDKWGDGCENCNDGIAK